MLLALRPVQPTVAPRLAAAALHAAAAFDLLLAACWAYRAHICTSRWRPLLMYELSQYFVSNPSHAIAGQMPDEPSGWKAMTPAHAAAHWKVLVSQMAEIVVSDQGGCSPAALELCTKLGTTMGSLCTLNPYVMHTCVRPARAGLPACQVACSAFGGCTVMQWRCAAFTSLAEAATFVTGSFESATLHFSLHQRMLSEGLTSAVPPALAIRRLLQLNMETGERTPPGCAHWKGVLAGLAFTRQQVGPRTAWPPLMLRCLVQ